MRKSAGRENVFRFRSSKFYYSHPAKAGNQFSERFWIPAFAGMTEFQR